MENHTLKVLLVEDDEDDYLLIRDMFSAITRSRYDLDWVESYDAAVAMIDHCIHDVYLFDYRLGERSGLELLHEATSRGCKAPVIFLTGYGDYETDVKAMQAGAADYLLKEELSAPLLERCIRYAIVRKRAENGLSASTRFLEIANRHTEMAPLLQEFITAIRELTRCSAVGIRILDGKGHIPYEAHEGFSPAFLESENLLSIPWDRPATAGALKEPALMGLLQTEYGSLYPTASPVPAEPSGEEERAVGNLCSRCGYESVALVPVRLKGDAQGWIHVADPRKNMMPLEYIKILEVVAMQLGAAIQRIAAEESKRVEFAFRKAVEDSLTAGIVAIDSEGRQSHVNSAFCKMVGWSEEELLGKTAPFVYWPEAHRAEISRAFNAFTSGEAKSCRTELPFQRRNGEIFHALVMVSPLLDRFGEKIGWVSAINDISERIQMEEALKESEKQLKFLSAKLLSVQEEERARLAQEIHDRTGQTLAAVKFGLEAALEASARGRSEATVQTLQGLVPMVQDAIEEVRRVYMGLRPTVLDDFGIVATIGWLCREFTKVHHKIHIRRVIDIEEEEVPKALKVVIFRVVQEALENIAHHSEADQVELALVKTKGSLLLSVQDNGAGFDVKRVTSCDPAQMGLGLASMKERTELSQGTFGVDSAVGKGTLIRAVWQSNGRR